MPQSAASQARNAQLHFDPVEHRYTYLPDGREFISVTTLVEGCFEQFDADYWAPRKAGTRGYEGMTPEMVKRLWEERGRQARDLGTQMHARIERHYLGEEQDPGAATDPCFLQFAEFTRNWQLQPLATEWRIFDEEHGVAGTLDFLCTYGGKIYIYDWKRSSKVVNKFGIPVTSDRYGKTGYGPAAHVADCSYQHYALQLSIYRTILAERYGIHVDGCVLGIFHPDYLHFHRVELPYLRQEAQALLQYAAMGR